MNKLFLKKFLVISLSFGVICINSLYTSASPSIPQFTRSSPISMLKANSSIIESTPLQEGQTIVETITKEKAYTINTKDSENKEILLIGTKPVKAFLYSENFKHLESFDSGYFDYSTKINWDFVPWLNYTLVIIPQDGETKIRTQFQNKYDSSLMYVSSSTHETRRIIEGGKKDLYNLKFLSDGNYKVTIESNSEKLNVSLKSSFGLNENFVVGLSKKEFTLNAKSTGNYLDHSISLYNEGKPNSTATYTIKIEKFK